MIAELDASQAHDEERCRRERAHRETGRHLAEKSRLAELNRRDTEGPADFRHDGQRAEIERVRIEEEAEGHRDESEHERHVGRHRRGHRVGHRQRHGLEHAGACHDPGEGAGGEQDCGHHHGGPGMSVYPTALQLRRAVVHDQRDCRAEHEQDRRIDDTRDQHGHQEQREHGIDPESMRSPEPPFLVGQLARRGGDGFNPRRPKAALLACAQQVRDEEHEGQTDRLYGNHRPKQLGRRDVQGGRCPKRRAGPRQEVDARGHRCDTRQNAAVHSQAVVQRQHRRVRSRET